MEVTNDEAMDDIVNYVAAIEESKESISFVNKTFTTPDFIK